MKRIISGFLTLTLALVTAQLTGCGAAGDSPSGGNGGSSSSQSGSTAAMLPHGDTLYVLDAFLFKVFDISGQDSATLVKTETVPGAETLFIYEDHLYIGGANGVDIYDISDAQNPVEINYYPHARGCDPIIIEDDIGYITLRNRSQCWGDVNHLEIVDFSDPSSPIEITQLNMDYPYGLTYINDLLAICQEDFGLTLIDPKIDRSGESIQATPEEVANFKSISCFDALNNAGTLIVTAADGIHQYTMDDIYLQKISSIPIEPASSD